MTRNEKFSTRFIRLEERVRIGYTLLALLVGCAAVASAQVLPAGPSHIVLIRHGEEPSDAGDPHLEGGPGEGSAFVDFLTHDRAMIRLGAPVAIFATETTKDDNGQRTQETVTPLAGAVRLPY